MVRATLFEDQQQKQLGLGFGPAEGAETTTTGECEDAGIVEVKKRKRREKKKLSVDTGLINDGDDSDIRLEIKKSKRDDLKSAESVEWESSNSGSSLTRGKSSHLGSSLNREKDNGCSGVGSDLMGGKSSDLGCSFNREEGKEVSDLGSNLERGKSSDFGSGLKREKGKGCALGSQPNESLESGKYSDVGSGFEELLKQVEGKYVDLGMTEKKKKKKKRKRDEIEAEYKERQCGAMRMNGGGEGGSREGMVVGEKRKHVDDPEEMMMVSKDDDFDDEAILLRTVFVGNLPLKVKKKALVKEFSRFGEIESVRIRSIPLLDTKVWKEGAIIQKKTSDAVDSVHAYIVFKTEEAAQASLANNMALVRGNHVSVDRACPPRKKLKGGDAPLYDNKRTVIVGNLPFDVKDEEIFQLFSGIKDLESSIEAIRVIRDSRTNGGANLVLNLRSLKLRDSELRLYHARSDLTPSKRKNSSPGEREDSATMKLGVDLRTPDNRKKVKTKSGSLDKKKKKSGSSYQGLQASTSGASEEAGGKRKLESQTPESYRSKKKLRILQ